MRGTGGAGTGGERLLPSVRCPRLSPRETGDLHPPQAERGGESRGSLTAGRRSGPVGSRGVRSELLPRRHPCPPFPSCRLSVPSPSGSCSISRRPLSSSSPGSAAPEGKGLRGAVGQRDRRGWEKPSQTPRDRITPRYCPIFFKIPSKCFQLTCCWAGCGVICSVCPGMGKDGCTC